MLTILKMYDHLNWANKRILTSLESFDNAQHKAIDNAEHKAIQLFAHILQSEQVWFTRLQGKDTTSMELWPDADLHICAQLVIYNQSDFRAYLTQRTNADLDGLISYKNQAGSTYQTSIRGILTHVALHGQYHRGQINSLLRLEEGMEPINVDFITFVR